MQGLKGNIEQRCLAQKLEALEKEEELREAAGLYDSDSDDDPEMDEIRKTARKYVESRHVLHYRD